MPLHPSPLKALLVVALTVLSPGCASVSGDAGDGRVEAPAAVSLGWLRSFRDPALVALAEEAAAGNRDLRALAARLEAGREGVFAARAPRLPSVNLGMGGSGSGTAVRGADGELGDFSRNEDYRVAVNASWELDVWGRLAALHRAGVADFERQQADFAGARLSLAGQTARAWCQLITARQQVALAEQTHRTFQRNLGVVERSFRNGDAFASALDVKFARNQLAAAGRSVEVQRLAADESRRSLEVLLGRYPAAAIEGNDRLPKLPGAVPSGIPAAVLERRPDVRAAAAQLQAAAERAGAAEKALLPSISLTASGSTASGDLLGALSDPASLARSIAASLGQPVFRGGALRAASRQASALEEAAVESLAGVVLKAFREVESALAAGQSLERQQALLAKELEQAELAERQASREYSQGTVSYLSVLEAQRRAVTARSQNINMQNARLLNRIDLHLAIGGDFSSH